MLHKIGTSVRVILPSSDLHSFLHLHNISDPGKWAAVERSRRQTPLRETAMVTGKVASTPPRSKFQTAVKIEEGLYKMPRKKAQP